MLNMLTAMRVARLRTPGRHADGGGLYLQVTDTKTKSWLFRYSKAGKTHNVGLGALHTLSLAEARDKARGLRQLLLEGRDPLTEKWAQSTARAIAQARGCTFKHCADGYMRTHSGTWKSVKHQQQWASTLTNHAYPIIGALPVAAIDTALVLRVLEPIWTVTPETASRVRGRIEAVLDWATAQELRRGENPARWRGHLENLLAGRKCSTKHHAALPYDQMPEFMQELRQRDSLSARALEFCILTAARTGEVIGATWDEIDGNVWTVPAERMKGGRPHRVPLSDRAVEILGPRGTGRIFPLSNMAMLEMLRGLRAGYTVHGFRSTFSDWARDCTGFHRDVVEAALAHAISDKAEAAYRRQDALEKRKRLMREWSAFCNADPVSTVVPLRA
jgi:integrase